VVLMAGGWVVGGWWLVACRQPAPDTPDPRELRARCCAPLRDHGTPRESRELLGSRRSRYGLHHLRMAAPFLAPRLHNLTT